MTRALSISGFGRAIETVVVIAVRRSTEAAGRDLSFWLSPAGGLR